MKSSLVSFLVLAVAIAPGATAGERSGLYVETGLVAGGVIGVESPSHSPIRAVSDIGYLWGLNPGAGRSAWGGGATLYLGLGGEDLRLGIKPRLRYSFDSNWSFDVSAGYIFATSENEPGVSDTGFVGGLHLNRGSWLTLRADVNVKRVASWTTYSRSRPVVHQGGYETAVYGGLAFRNGPGWVATAVGVAAMFGLMLLVLASGGGS